MAGAGSKKGSLLIPQPSTVLRRLCLFFIMRHIWDARVPMRDGVHLSADVYLPDKSGSYPTVVIGTPYDNTMKSHVDMAVLLRNPQLRIHHIRCAGKIRQRRRLLSVLQRGTRRIRPDRVDGGAAMVRRQTRHDGRKLQRLDPVGNRQGKATTPRNHDPNRNRRQLDEGIPATSTAYLVSGCSGGSTS